MRCDEVEQRETSSGSERLLIVPAASAGTSGTAEISGIALKAGAL